MNKGFKMPYCPIGLLFESKQRQNVRPANILNCWIRDSYSWLNRNKAYFLFSCLNDKSNYTHLFDFIFSVFLIYLWPHSLRLQRIELLARINQYSYQLISTSYTHRIAWFTHIYYSKVWKVEIARFSVAINIFHVI